MAFLLKGERGRGVANLTQKLRDVLGCLAKVRKGHLALRAYLVSRKGNQSFGGGERGD